MTEQSALPIDFSRHQNEYRANPLPLIDSSRLIRILDRLQPNQTIRVPAIMSMPEYTEFMSCLAIKILSGRRFEVSFSDSGIALTRLPDATYSLQKKD